MLNFMDVYHLKSIILLVCLYANLFRMYTQFPVFDNLQLSDSDKISFQTLEEWLIMKYKIGMVDNSEAISVTYDMIPKVTKGIKNITILYIYML